MTIFHEGVRPAASRAIALGKRLDPSAAFGGKLKQPFDRQAVEGAKRSRS
jgi:hypothetical protein